MRGYSLLGWLVWKIGGMVVRRKIAQNQTKVIAAGLLAVVIVGGAIAGIASGGDDDE